MPPAASSPLKPWRVVARSVILRVRLTPKSSRDAIDGVDVRADGAVIKARVRAVPEDGKANAALEALVADWLDAPKRNVAVIGGQTSRLKSVAVTGDPEALVRQLADQLGLET